MKQMIPNTNIKEINGYISQVLDACKEYRQQLAEKTNEVERLRGCLAESERQFQEQVAQVIVEMDKRIEAEGQVARLREKLELIASPMRPDGTYNRDRRACEKPIPDEKTKEALMNQPQTPDNCPFCGAKSHAVSCDGDENTDWYCGTDYVSEWGFSRSSECYENELTEKTNEVARLRELLNRAIGYTKNALFFARTYDNKIQWNEIDELWDGVRDLEKETLAPAPEETQDGATMDEWYGGFSKIVSTQPVIQDSRITEPDPDHIVDANKMMPEWRELGPDELIGVNDEYNPASLGEWIKVPHGWIGERCDITKVRTLRPLPVQEEMPLEK